MEVESYNTARHEGGEEAHVESDEVDEMGGLHSE